MDRSSDEDEQRRKRVMIQITEILTCPGSASPSFEAITLKSSARPRANARTIAERVKRRGLTNQIQ